MWGAFPINILCHFKNGLCGEVEILKYSWKSNPKSLNLFYQFSFSFEMGNISRFSYQEWPDMKCRGFVQFYFVFQADCTLYFIIFPFQ